MVFPVKRRQDRPVFAREASLEAIEAALTLAVEAQKRVAEEVAWLSAVYEERTGQRAKEATSEVP